MWCGSLAWRHLERQQSIRPQLLQSTVQVYLPLRRSVREEEQEEEQEQAEKETEKKRKKKQQNVAIISHRLTKVNKQHETCYVVLAWLFGDIV